MNINRKDAEQIAAAINRLVAVYQLVAAGAAPSHHEYALDDLATTITLAQIEEPEC